MRSERLLFARDAHANPRPLYTAAARDERCRGQPFDPRVERRLYQPGCTVPLITKAPLPAIAPFSAKSPRAARGTPRSRWVQTLQDPSADRNAFEAASHPTAPRGTGRG